MYERNYMNRKKLKNTEWKILIYVTLLLIIGLIALYSASTSTEFAEFKKQLMWIGIGIPLLSLMMFIDYRLLARFSPILYITSIILLLLVLFTPAVNGATSWFNIGSFSMQPAEFAKIAVILFLASTISKLRI
jgi:cell division protein FtsW (lipid II flippase)